jgi:hypothetical protein
MRRRSGFIYDIRPSKDVIVYTDKVMWVAKRSTWYVIYMFPPNPINPVGRTFPLRKSDPHNTRFSTKSSFSPKKPSFSVNNAT